jgi:hypothetical protein
MSSGCVGAGVAVGVTVGVGVGVGVGVMVGVGVGVGVDVGVAVGVRVGVGVGVGVEGPSCEYAAAAATAHMTITMAAKPKIFLFILSPFFGHGYFRCDYLIISQKRGKNRKMVEKQKKKRRADCSTNSGLRLLQLTILLRGCFPSIVPRGQQTLV